jgi:hypothetical protein
LETEGKKLSLEGKSAVEGHKPGQRRARVDVREVGQIAERWGLDRNGVAGGGSCDLPDWKHHRLDGAGARAAISRILAWRVTQHCTPSPNAIQVSDADGPAVASLRLLARPALMAWVEEGTGLRTTEMALKNMVSNQQASPIALAKSIAI